MSSCDFVTLTLWSERIESMRLCASSTTTTWLHAQGQFDSANRGGGQDELLERKTESFASRLLHEHVVREGDDLSRFDSAARPIVWAGVRFPTQVLDVLDVMHGRLDSTCGERVGCSNSNMNGPRLCRESRSAWRARTTAGGTGTGPCRPSAVLCRDRPSPRCCRHFCAGRRR